MFAKDNSSQLSYKIEHEAKYVWLDFKFTSSDRTCGPDMRTTDREWKSKYREMDILYLCLFIEFDDNTNNIVYP